MLSVDLMRVFLHTQDYPCNRQFLIKRVTEGGFEYRYSEIGRFRK